MTQIEKLVQKLQRLRADAEYSDVHRLLDWYGWTRGRQTGSHMTYTKAGEKPISFPLVSGRRVKPSYRRLVLERLGLGGA